MSKPVGSSFYNVSYRQEALPPIEVKDGVETINLSLTIPESILASFVYPMIKSSLEKNCNLFYIGTSEKMQKDFGTWVVEKYGDNIYQSDTFELVPLISSLWNKTRSFVDNELNIIKNQEMIKNENYWNLEAQSSSIGLSGRIFTTRQANVLLCSVNSIELHKKSSS